MTRFLRSFLAFSAVALMLIAIYGVNRFDEAQTHALDGMRTGSWHFIQAEQTVHMLDASLARHRDPTNQSTREKVATDFDNLCNRISTLLEAQEINSLRPRMDMQTINIVRNELDAIDEVLGYLLLNPGNEQVRRRAETIIDDMRASMRAAVVAALAHEYEGAGRKIIMSIHSQTLFCLVLVAIGGGLLYVLFLVEKKLNVRLLEQARASERAATDANQAKTRFLASASHDLRQPLNALNIILSLLQRRMKEPRDRIEFDHCLNAVDQISRQLDLYLDITRFDSGSIVPHPEMVEIDPIIESVRSTLAHEAKSKGLQLSMSGSGLRVMTDPRLMERVIANLAGNAVRHTTDGFVLIRCTPHEGGARLDVIDTGPGIPQDRRDEIFQEFVQIANPARQMKNGYGLGLAIVRRLVDLLGHDLDVSSEVGRGSTFSVRIAQAEATAAPPATIGEATPFPLVQPFGAEDSSPPDAPATAAALPSELAPDDDQVLIIEDDRLVASSLATMIVDLGKTPIVTHDAVTAVAAATAAGRGITSIVADYRLTGEDGLAAIARVRGRIGPVPAFLVTGDIGQEVRRKAEAAGVLYLKKPVSVAAITRLITEARQHHSLGHV